MNKRMKAGKEGSFGDVANKQRGMANDGISYKKLINYFTLLRVLSVLRTCSTIFVILNI